MKKIFLLVAFFVFGKICLYAQYPLTQQLGSDSTIVISKGALQSRLINVTYTDTAAANLQRIRQYPGAQIATTSGGINLWVRNANATAWLPINTGSGNNIYTINGTLTGNRTLTGGGYPLTFTGLDKFVVSADSVRFTTGDLKFGLNTDSASLTKKISYSGNYRGDYKQFTLVDKGYVDSVVASSPAGTVTSIATNNGSGITGGTITSTGTLAIDTTNVISTKANVASGLAGKLNISDTAAMLAPYLRAIDTTSLSNRINLKLNISDTASMLGNYLNNVGYGLSKAGQVVSADSATLSNYYLRRKDSLTTTNPLGYVTKQILADTAAAIRASDAGGSVTSVATNNGTGITGGTITTSGTLAIDTTVISTRAWRQKGVDSLQANINLKLNISDTANMLNPYLRKVDTTNIWITNVYRKTATDSVFYVKGGNSTFAYRDSIGSGGGGGGGGKVYYLNGSVNQGTFGGLTMYALGDTAITGASADFTRATTGTIANFITNVNQPYLISIPSGIWVINAYMSESGGGANHAEVYAILETWNGSTLTSIATSPTEEITNGSTPDLYTFGISLPTTTISLTDRIVIQFYIQNTNGKTVTLYTQNGKVGEVITTFTTGIGALNGLTAPSQFFATGTSGTDFNISSVTATHTFNLPTASATNRGALSTTDWTTFNNKVGGSLISGYIPKATGTNTIDTSQLFQNGQNVGIGTLTPNGRLAIVDTGGFALKINYNSASNVSDSNAAIYAENNGLSSYVAIFNEKTTNNTGAQLPLLIESSLTTGTPQANMGTGVDFGTRDDANNRKLNRFIIRGTDPAAATYTSRAEFRLWNNGVQTTPYYWLGNGNMGLGTSTPDSNLTVVNGAYFQRGIRASGLPAAPGTKALRIDASGTLSYADTLIDAGGTVTSVATNDGTGITGGTITTSGTLAIDTLLISTRAWRQKGVDSLQANINLKLNISDTASMLSPYLRSNTAAATYVPQTRTITINGTSQDLTANRTYNVGTVTSVGATAGTGISVSGSPITSSGSFTITNTAPDQTVVLNNGTGISVSGTYPTFTITNTSPSSGGTVTSVGSGTGLSGGPITTSGTLSVDTLLMSTRAWRQKGIDSVISVMGSRVNGTTNYVSKFTGTNTIGNSQIFDNATSVGIGTAFPSASYKLDVNGNINVSNAVNYSQGGTKYGWTYATVGAMAMEGLQGADISLGTGSGAVATERMVIKNSGIVGIGITPDSMFTVAQGTHLQRGVRMSGLPSAVGTKSLRIDASGTVSVADTLANGVSGSGTTNRVSKFTASGAIGNSSIRDSSSSVALDISSQGNLGVGYVPNTWFSSVKTIQLPQGSLYSYSSPSKQLGLGLNYYADAIGTERYMENGFASIYDQVNGTHRWYTAPSGIANNQISFTSRMLLQQTGELVLGNFNSDSMLNVQYGAQFGTGVRMSGLPTAPGTRAVRINANGTLSVSDTLTNGISGSGTTNYIPKFTSSSAIGNSNLQTDASGNLGLGVTPSAWGSGYTGFQMGSLSGLSMFAYSGGNEIGQNFYYDTGYKYATTGAASEYVQSGGVHYWRYAASGTANTSLNWTAGMTLFSTGNLAVGGTSDNGSRLNVTGAGYFSGNLTSSGIASLGIGETTNLAYIGDRTTVNTRYIKFNRASALTDIVNIQGVNGGVGAANIALQAEGGNVGIGTISPNSIFEVKNSGTGASYSIAAGFRDNSTNGNGLEIWNKNGESRIISTYYTTASNQDLTFWTTQSNGAQGERMRITSGGNVGIGTTSPQAKFVVSNGGTQNIEIDPSFIQSFNRTTPGYAELPFYASKFSFNVGNVGIGTTSPQSQLHIYNSGGTATLRLHGTRTSDGSVGVLNFSNITDISGGYIIGSIGVDRSGFDNGGAMIFSTAVAASTPTERMRITSGGNVGIGTQTPDANSKLDVNGQAFVARLALYNDNGTPSLGTSPLLYSPASGTLAISTASSERMRITTGGDVGINTQTPNATFHVAGSIAAAIAIKTATYTLTSSDYTVVFDLNGNATANLPNATTCSGRIYVIKINRTNVSDVLTIDPNGAQTIDGNATYDLQCQQAITIQSDGSNWRIIGDYAAGVNCL